MLLPADRLFDHKICREAAERAQHGQDTARHLQALHTTLAALADRVLEQKCGAAGFAGAAVMQALAAARQQRQVSGSQPSDAVSLPLKRRHSEASWPWQQQEPQQAALDGLNPVAAGYSSSPAAGAGSSRGGEHGGACAGRWLQEVLGVVSADVVWQVLHDLQHKHIYHTCAAERTYDAAALDAAVMDLFGFQVLSA